MTLPRLYAILDLDVCASRGLDPRRLFDVWLAAGIRLIQLRAKQSPSGPLLELSGTLTSAARSARATFIVNDRADIATLSGASGVHIGQADLAAVDARIVVGPSAIVGVSTHNDEQVAQTLTEPVDYVAIGPVFSTLSKVRADPVVGLAGVRRAREMTAPSGRPLVAIGGITLARARSVLEAGADSVAVISDLVIDDPAARAREFLRVVHQA